MPSRDRDEGRSLGNFTFTVMPIAKTLQAAERAKC